MAFYDLSKGDRVRLVRRIQENIGEGFRHGEAGCILKYFSDDDTYVRKAAYQAVGKVYKSSPELHARILVILKTILRSDLAKVRQTAVNAAGEIGIHNFEAVQYFFDTGLFDPHHSVRNAVIGSLKKMSEKNPVPTLQWAKLYLHHDDKEIRREVCHGIELRGRTHPQDILPLLEQLQHDKTSRVRNTLIHVLGQIAYKKGCLPVVVQALSAWDNQILVKEAIEEIVDVHRRYKNFAALTAGEAKTYIEQYFSK
ncbi:hypothetical protein C900_02399 [Fulvivirga imtechensis AK7]|uniref:HEAT repeat domain-containing protein n=1 Tax=Fulvivirga imtechensis AK7 TaxID=1237149 RepID=L8JTU0_9BACT|nr:HEAT repeat domain-containing protein [Fulvivirga imtechensis]ELR71663.1 hypothetical protein C900_02399 [Fulvivirga imtechensis AK7]